MPVLDIIHSLKLRTGRLAEGGGGGVKQLLMDF